MESRVCSQTFVAVLSFFVGLKTSQASSSDTELAIRNSRFRPRGSIECSSVDVREHLSAKMREFFSHPRDQGAVGMCYANTAADLLSFELNRRVSSAYLLFRYQARLTGFDHWWREIRGHFENPPEEGFDGGVLSKALKLSLTKSVGMCAESDMPSSQDDPLPADERSLGERLNGYWQAVELAQQNHPIESVLRNSQMGRFFPDLSTGDMQSFIERGLQSGGNVYTILGDLAQTACHNRIAPPRHLSVHRYSAFFTALLDPIDKRLNSGKPAGIMYDYGNTRKDQPPSEFNRLIGVHVSSVIGRRFNEIRGRCEYLIRDSYGSSCEPYRSENVECNCQMGPDGCRGDGTFWIADELLNQITSSVSHL